MPFEFPCDPGCKYLDLQYMLGNALLAVGGNIEMPDYDYTKDLTLKYYLPEEGSPAKAEIPDLTGKTVLTATASLSGNEVTIELSDAQSGVKAEIHTKDGKVISADLTDKKTVIKL